MAQEKQSSYFVASLVIVLALSSCGGYVLSLGSNVDRREGEAACETTRPPGSYAPKQDLPKDDADLLLHALNLEYLEAEFFLHAAYGKGLDHFAPDLAAGGPPPNGAQLANLDPVIEDITQQFGLQEVGHVRAIKETIPNAFSRPQLDLRKEVFAEAMEKAVGRKLQPPFDPYEDSLKFLLAIYLIPYVGLTGYVGATPTLSSPTAKRLAGGLLAVESGQDAVIRALLYTRREEVVKPYDMKVGECTERLSRLRNELGKSGVVDEGLRVPKCLGAEGKTEGNILAGDKYSLGYARTPDQILGIIYGTGDPATPGGFYPQGAKGYFAERSFPELRSELYKR